jgi:hypothetical protein
MNTRLLMGASALFMASLGVLASFLPQEILGYAGARPDALPVLLIQATGALYLGFAMLNWSSRGNLIGGIYARPTSLGNFMHFAVVSVTLLKATLGGQHAPVVLVGLAVYLILAIGFGWTLFTHPVERS